MSFGWWRTPRRYVTEQAFQKNLRNQLTMSPSTLEQLRKGGVGEAAHCRLEVFFYSNSQERAQALADQLARSGYAVEARPSAHDKSLWLVNGWSTPVQMTESVLLEWTASMCRTGFEHDCEFDGWGTFPDQSQIESLESQRRNGGV